MIWGKRTMRGPSRRKQESASAGALWGGGDEKEEERKRKKKGMGKKKPSSASVFAVLGDSEQASELPEKASFNFLILTYCICMLCFNCTPIVALCSHKQTNKQTNMSCVYTNRTTVARARIRVRPKAEQHGL